MSNIVWIRTNSSRLLLRYSEIFLILAKKVKKFEIFPSLWYINDKADL